MSANPQARDPDYWRRFAAIAAEGDDCPLYAALARRIAEDGDIQALAALAQPGQPPSNLLFAAVHFLLLGGARHSLARFYPHLTQEPTPPVDETAWADFRSVLRQEEQAIAALVAGRVTNTNEVLRCTYLRCGYATISARSDAPLSLIELGPSAGLNLNWDRYGYLYRRNNGLAVHAGPPHAALRLDAEVRGRRGAPAPTMAPPVARRIGLELNPVDLTAEPDRRWLMALVWPGRPERIARLQAALAIASDYPPPIRAGDALAHLADELAAAPGDSARVVAHTLVTYQWTVAMRARLEAILMEAGRERPVWRLSHDLGDGERGGEAMALRLRRYDGGAVAEETIATAHHHGAWIDWAEGPA